MAPTNQDWKLTHTSSKASSTVASPVCRPNLVIYTCKHAHLIPGICLSSFGFFLLDKSAPFLGTKHNTSCIECRYYELAREHEKLGERMIAEDIRALVETDFGYVPQGLELMAEDVGRKRVDVKLERDREYSRGVAKIKVDDELLAKVFWNDEAINAK